MKAFQPIAGLMVIGASVVGQTNSGRFPCPPEGVSHYTAYRAVGPVQVDGKLDELTWRSAPSSPRFVDIITGKPTLHETRASVVWDDQYLYVSYRVEEPLVHAKFTRHNDFIYQDNDVELFIAGPDAYYELEINAFNTRYEAFFAWQNTIESSGLSQRPEFEHTKLVPFNGVGWTNHVRGFRWGNFDYALPGLKTGVFIDGTVNNDTDRDRGWTVEVAVPWSSLGWLATDRRALPPEHGDVWRMDFSRFNTYKEAPPAHDSGGWFWTPHGVWDSHIPECFAFITFVTNSVAHAQVPIEKR